MHRLRDRREPGEKALGRRARRDRFAGDDDQDDLEAELQDLCVAEAVRPRLDEQRRLAELCRRAAVGARWRGHHDEPEREGDEREEKDEHERIRHEPPDDALGGRADVPRGGWRDRVRSKPGVGLAYRVGVFLAGLLFIILGFALAVLPGPLTIPPVHLGRWLWSTEFRFAQRFFESFKRKAREAWAHAKQHPLSSAAITLGGIAAAVAVAWAVKHFGLVAKAQDAVGL